LVYEQEQDAALSTLVSVCTDWHYAYTFTESRINY